MTDTDRICSARRCRNTATRQLRWRNPAIHTGDRHKTWLACDDHHEFLSDFLTRRGFPLQTTALPVDPP
ncbi:hypothetical protein LX16_1954 [Stackebrandtia albiflava]|uniref:Acetone carboxylase n=1 Tax=Stackebrandtia albiflava TaxID=406432 RepID=A0A562VEI5_9ACTN|nr:hypothetical protein [Stackebrandtia albiflava]TWJ16227.1 hypothetical protein LX16_1954 [Stackebrandtia albiflava]